MNKNSDKSDISDIFTLDISNKKTQIACNTLAKFLPPNRWKFYFQKPKTIKDLQIFSFAHDTPEENNKQLESIKTSLKSGHIITRKNNSVCRNNDILKSNVLFHEIVGATLTLSHTFPHAWGGGEARAWPRA
jgi:hypothetical protein